MHFIEVFSRTVILTPYGDTSYDLTLAHLLHAQVKLSEKIKEFIQESTGNYGKAKLVLQKNKFFVESPYPDVLKVLLKVKAAKSSAIWRMSKKLNLLRLQVYLIGDDLNCKGKPGLNCFTSQHNPAVPIVNGFT